MSGLVDAMYWSGSGIAPGSRFKGSIRDGLNGAVGAGVGAPCEGRMAGVRGPAARARAVYVACRVGAEGKSILPWMNANERG